MQAIAAAKSVSDVPGLQGEFFEKPVLQRPRSNETRATLQAAADVALR
jgi:hypothetical protein